MSDKCDLSYLDLTRTWGPFDPIEVWEIWKFQQSFNMKSDAGFDSENPLMKAIYQNYSTNTEKCDTTGLLQTRNDILEGKLWYSGM